MENKERIEEVATFIHEHSMITWLSSIDLAEDLYDAGYRKQIEAEWIDAGFDECYKCSNCGYIYHDKERLEQNPQHFLYCGHCGAKIVGYNK